MREPLLVVSDDSHLLQTRSEVLRHSGADVLPYISQQLLTQWPETDIVLAILCHTLDDATRLAVHSGVRERWPQARVIQVVSALQLTRIDGPNAISSNPRLLVKGVISTLHASKAQAS